MEKCRILIPDSNDLFWHNKSKNISFFKKVSVQTFITEVGTNDAKGFLTYRRTQLILEKSSLFKNGFRFLLKKMTDLVVLDSQLIHD